MLSVHVAELFEDEVVGASEVERLGRELKLLLECNSHRDVVVGTSTADTTPEKELLKVNILRVI